MVSSNTNNKTVSYIYNQCFTVSFPVATKPKNGIRSVHITNTKIAHRASGI